MDKLGTIVIGKVYTPSTLESIKETDCVKVRLSCGGGIGGSCWEEYGTIDLGKNEKLADRRFVTLTDVVTGGKKATQYQLHCRGNSNKGGTCRL